MMLITYTCAPCQSWAGRNPTGLVQCSIPRGHKRAWETAQTLHMDTGNLLCLWSLMRSPRSEMHPLCEQTFPASVISQASPLGFRGTPNFLMVILGGTSCWTDILSHRLQGKWTIGPLVLLGLHCSLSSLTWWCLWVLVGRDASTYPGALPT